MGGFTYFFYIFVLILCKYPILGFPHMVTGLRFTMPTTRKKRKVSDLTADDANALLRTLAEFQEQLDEEDEDLPTGLISGLQQLRKKLEVIPLHCPFSKCLTHCRLIFFSLAYSIL